MTTATLVAAVALFAGAVVQSGLGFGFAIVAAPVVAATDGPATAAPTLAVASLCTSGLVLVAERRRREVLRESAWRLLAWSLPGMVAGALLLANAPARPLSVLVAVAVLVAIVLQLRGPRVADNGPPAPSSPSGTGAPGAGPTAGGPGSSGALAGVASGVLQTSVGLNGPPLVLHLLARGATPGQLRDTLAAVFFALSVISLGVFAATGTFRLAAAPVLLVAAAVLGWSLGRLAFRRLQAVHRPLSLATLAFGAAAALVQALVVA